jgi:serine/threonine protein kinase
MRGKVRNEVVAVKTIKHMSNKDFVLSLLEEIKVMSFLGKHENIVELVGASTRLLRRGNVYVFVEFCMLGSLEKYLKSCRNTFIDEIKYDSFQHSIPVHE